MKMNIMLQKSSANYIEECSGVNLLHYNQVRLSQEDKIIQ